MSWILGLDTSSTELNLCLSLDAVPQVSCTRYIQNSHAEYIAHAFRYCLSTCNIKAYDISSAGVTAGPGSFTGLRIGISFIKGLFLDQATSIVPISSLHCIAEAFTEFQGDIAVIMDARQNNVFTALFNRSQRTLTRISPDTCIPFEDVFSLYPSTTPILFENLGIKKSTLLHTLQKQFTVHEANSPILQRGAACVRICATTDPKSCICVHALDLVPVYLQNSYADEKKNLPPLGINR